MRPALAANATGTRAVAAAIEDALGIDPMLAGVMLDRAVDAVWLLVRERVLRFVARWHRPGTVDRAVRFHGRIRQARVRRSHLAAGVERR